MQSLFQATPQPSVVPSGLPDDRTQTVGGKQALATSDTSVRTPTNTYKFPVLMKSGNFNFYNVEYYSVERLGIHQKAKFLFVLPMPDMSPLSCKLKVAVIFKKIFLRNKYASLLFAQRLPLLEFTALQANF